MAKSLQEQLLGAGLIDKQRAQKLKTEQRKKKKQQPKGHHLTEETKQQAQQSLKDKAERDRQLNQQRQEKAQQKAIAAQIKQMIELNRVDRSKAEVAYQFSCDGKVKQIMVTEVLRDQIAKGRLAIVKLGNGFELVPTAVAEKIAQRDESILALKHERELTTTDENDPYAEYQVPDDLMW